MQKEKNDADENRVVECDQRIERQQENLRQNDVRRHSNGRGSHVVIPLQPFFISPLVHSDAEKKLQKQI